MSQDKGPEGYVTFGWVESIGSTKFVVDEFIEVGGRCVRRNKYVGNNSFSLIPGDYLQINHETDEAGHDLTAFVLNQSVQSPQETLPLSVPLRFVAEITEAA